MSRPRKKLDTHGRSELILEHFRSEPEGWRRDRLNCIRLGLQGDKSLVEIGKTLGINASTVADWFGRFREGGIDLLFTKDKGNGLAPAMSAANFERFRQELEKGKWRIASEAYDWAKEALGVTFKMPTIYKYLGKRERG